VSDARLALDLDRAHRREQRLDAATGKSRVAPRWDGPRTITNTFAGELAPDDRSTNASTGLTLSEFRRGVTDLQIVVTTPRAGDDGVIMCTRE
jgi:hypothetical protein